MPNRESGGSCIAGMRLHEGKFYYAYNTGRAWCRWARGIVSEFAVMKSAACESSRRGRSALHNLAPVSCTITRI